MNGIAHYVASKHAVVGLTKAVTKEYAGQGIRINAVCPGATQTPNYMRSTNGDVHLLDDMIPMQRIGQPQMPHAASGASAISGAMHGLAAASARCSSRMSCRMACVVSGLASTTRKTAIERPPH